MDMENTLHELGLSKSQARAYMILIDNGRLDPLSLAKKTGEARTNAYMIMERLADLGLAVRDEVKKKRIYRPSSPLGLQRLAERQRAKAHEQERKIKQAMPDLLRYFHEKYSQPSVRFLQGHDGINQIYKDHLAQDGDIYVFRTQEDYKYYGDDLNSYLEDKARKGIKTEIISPQSKIALQNFKNNPLGREFTWVPEESYTAPVEISIYGNKAAFTSFGEEAVALIVESPQIAKALREIFLLVKTRGI